MTYIIHTILYWKAMSEIKKTLKRKEKKPMLGYKGYICTVERQNQEKLFFDVKIVNVKVN